jgi:hypothetical protein
LFDDHADRSSCCQPQAPSSHQRLVELRVSSFRT